MKRVVYSSWVGDIEGREEALKPGHTSFNYKGKQKVAVDIDNDENIQITEIHPYDDAEYTWVRWKADDPYCYLYNSGKLETRMAVPAFDWDMYDDYHEYLNDVTEIMIDEMINHNTGVNPVIRND